MKLVATLALLMLALAALSIAGPLPRAQDGDEARDRLGLFEFFLGKWEGTGKGPDGSSKLTRSYEMVLSRYIHSRNHSAFTKSSGEAGEVHEDWGFLSWDEQRETYVLREFHNEGYVNQYVPEISEDTSTYTYTTESVENMDAGWRARTTVKITGDDSFEETFELCPPGGDFFQCVSASLRRKE